MTNDRVFDAVYDALMPHLAHAQNRAHLADQVARIVAELRDSHGSGYMRALAGSADERAHVRLALRLDNGVSSAVLDAAVLAAARAFADGEDPAEVVSLDLYSRALDEIYLLRTALAYEAGVIAAHLTLATFPRSRRGFAEEQVSRMRAAARGESGEAYGDVPERSRRSALRDAGASETLTRWEWERP